MSKLEEKVLAADDDLRSYMEQLNAEWSSKGVQFQFVKEQRNSEDDFNIYIEITINR
jgi:hypothetical protein